MSQTPAPSQSPSARPASRRLPLVVAVFVVLCGLALGLAVYRMSARSGLESVGAADPADSALVARGKELYTARCASCHGVGLEGAAGWPQRDANGLLPAPPLGPTGTLPSRDDRWIFTAIARGGAAIAAPGTPSSMPPFGDALSDAEIWALVSYLKSTWPPETRAAQP